MPVTLGQDLSTNRKGRGTPPDIHPGRYCSPPRNSFATSKDKECHDRQRAKK